MLTDSEVDQFKKYIDKLDENHQKMASTIAELLDSHRTLKVYPICVPSYNRRDVSVLLNDLNTLSSEYRVYCYESQKDMYSDLNCVYVPDEILKKPYPLGSKLNFMIDDSIKRCDDVILRCDDDIYQFCIPIPLIRHYGLVNEREVLSLNMVANLWSFCIQRYKLDVSGLVSWYSFRFRECDDKQTDGFLINNNTPVCCFSINLKNGFRFDDETISWEDYDYFLQCATSGLNCQTILMCDRMVAPGLVSTLDYSQDKHIQRSFRLFERWGTKLIKVDSTKYAFDVKLNWINIKNANFDFASLKQPISISNEQKQRIISLFDDNRYTKMQKNKMYIDILNESNYKPLFS